MIILYHVRFEKRFKKLTRRIKELVAQKIELFAKDPLHHTLRNHALQGEYSSYRSIDIKGDLSAIYKEEATGVVRFCYLVTHHELYG